MSWMNQWGHFHRPPHNSRCTCSFLFCYWINDTLELIIKFLIFSPNLSLNQWDLQTIRGQLKLRVWSNNTKQHQRHDNNDMISSICAWQCFIKLNVSFSGYYLLIALSLIWPLLKRPVFVFRIYYRVLRTWCFSMGSIVFDVEISRGIGISGVEKMGILIALKVLGLRERFEKLHY